MDTEVNMDPEVKRIDRDYQIIDRSTGEVVSASKFFASSFKDWFEMTRVAQLAEFIKSGDSPSDLVLAFILQSKKHNQILGSIRAVATEVGVSPGTVNRLFKRLQEKDLLRKVQNGVYILNPRVCCTGGNAQRTVRKAWENAK